MLRSCASFGSVGFIDKCLDGRNHVFLCSIPHLACLMLIVLNRLTQALMPMVHFSNQVQTVVNKFIEARVELSNQWDCHN